MVTETITLTATNFSSIPPTMPSTWYLGNFIPNGALDRSHVEARYRPAAGAWTSWEAVTAWSQATKTATYFKPGVIDEVEFRRKTPRYVAYLDPLLATSRVSEKNFKANADQGAFVAVEWAAQYGLDAYAVPLADPGLALNQLGLVQLTQNHWGPDADFTKTSWNFYFAGGYIARSHVKAQALLPSGWVQLAIDPDENDPSHPSVAPFRFIGDYQLRLDLSTLAGPVTGLIIYRHTPRIVEVDVPLDATRITAPGMEPSARHAFFVAVEIGEELSRHVPTCECEEYVYYTSLIYPTLVSDTLSLGAPVPKDNSSVWGLPDDSLALAHPVPRDTSTLVAAISHINYTNGRDFNADTLATPLPVPRDASTLVVTINYLDYTNGRDFNADTLAVPHAVPQGASTLVVTISYIDYTNGRDFGADTLTMPLPIPQSGTLV